MPRFGFIGPTYTAQSPSASAEKAVNLYVQMLESDGKSRAILLPSPGLKSFATLGADAKVRSISEYKGRCFAVGQSFYEVFIDGSVTAYNVGATGSSALASDANPASIAAAGSQVLIASGGGLYVFNLSTNLLTLMPAIDPLGVIQVGTSDGYFISLVANSNKLRISSLLDATTWPGAQVIAVSYFPDNIVSMIVDHRELALLGPKSGLFYSDTGSLNIFDPIGGAFMEMGSGSTFGMVRADNSFCWVSRDERGSAMGHRVDGYGPKRITTHAVETAWQSYQKISDCVSYSYQEQGHTFWHVFFPSVDSFSSASWRFDFSTGLWHEVGYWNAPSAHFDAQRSQCHCFVFGKHLVGDWNSGTIYDMSSAYFDDFGNPVRRLRRAPYIASEEEWIAHNRLQVLLEAGLALQNGQGSNPLINMRFSDDGGHTYSIERSVSAGLVGQYRARAKWERLGRSRGRVYEISFSDPIAWRLIDAFINDSMEGGPTQRLNDQLRKSA